jgi:hypothetical protein
MTPVLAPGHTPASVTTRSARSSSARRRVVVRRHSAIAFGARDDAARLADQALFVGTGIWGNNQPVGWGFDIINFVWWIGIGHAGTLISAILLLLSQEWRTSINRFAEAMTLFAVACAGSTRSSTPAARGSRPTGCCPTPTPWGCGPTSAAR